MSVTSQLFIVFLLIASAIIYFINRGQGNKNNTDCDKNCSQCNLYKHCKTKN